jgi:DNA modification methylase
MHPRRPQRPDRDPAPKKPAPSPITTPRADLDTDDFDATNDARRPSGSRNRNALERPPLRIFTTSLWEYPSQHYDSWLADDGSIVRSKRQVPGPRGMSMQGDKAYIGATPSWVIWQLLMRYTRPGDLVIDPMCGSGTTIDVCRDLDRRALAYDVAPSRPDIFRADARQIPLEDAKADFVFLDPPYGTNVHYSDDPRCIGTLDVHGPDHGSAYYAAMTEVFANIHRVLKNRRFFALYVCDSFQKKKDLPQAQTSTSNTSSNKSPARPGGTGVPPVLRPNTPINTGQPRSFAPIGFELFQIMSRYFVPMDIIAVARKNQKLQRSNWRKAAEEGNFFLRGFNFLFIMKKQDA